MTDRELLDRKGHEVNDDLPPLPEPKYIYHRSDTPGEDDLFEFAEYGAVDTDSEGRVCQGCERLYTADQLRAAVLAERERCAKVCERVSTEAMQKWVVQYTSHDQGCSHGASECADAIRKGTP